MNIVANIVCYVIRLVGKFLVDTAYPRSGVRIHETLSSRTTTSPSDHQRVGEAGSELASNGMYSQMQFLSNVVISKTNQNRILNFIQIC